MEKQFIPLNSKVAPVSNPFKVRTWELPESQKRSVSPETTEKPYVKKVKKQLKGSSEDLVKNELAKASEAWSNRRVKKTCQPHDSYVECVRLQRRPDQVRQHAIVRERIIQVREQLRERSCYIEKEKKFAEDYDLIKLPSIPDVVQVKHASPTPSTEVVYVPSRKLLDLKKPKSGIYINETPYVEPRPLPRDYDPRMLQNKIDEQQQIFDVANVNGEEMVRFADEEEENLIKPCCCGFGSRNYDLQQTKGVPEKVNFLDLNIEVYNLEEMPTPRRKPSHMPFVPFGGTNVGRPGLQYAQHQRQTEIILPPDGISTKLYAEFKVEKTSYSDKTSRRPEPIAAIYAAYAYNFIQPLQEWNMSTILQIMNLGKSLHEKSVQANYQTTESDFDIDERLVIKKVPIKVSSGTPVFVGTIDTDSSGTAEVLKNFFMDYNAAIFSCDNSFLLIWKQCKNYYVFDPSGRERQTLRLNEKEGCAALITCSNLLDVTNLIVNRSGFMPYSTFKLYEINLKSYNVPFEMKDDFKDSKPKKHYTVVHKHFALIRGGDGLPTSARSKLNPSMLMSCLARIYSDIHPPRFWSKSIVDQLRKYALGIFTNQVKHEKLKVYNISNLPRVHRLGSYRTEINIFPFQMTGQVNQCPTFRTSQLAAALCTYLEKHDIALVQVDSFTVAVWKDSKFFYVFDPFRRSPAGLADTGEYKGAACLQIHLTLRSMCSILYNNARAMATDGNFFIHGIEIIKTRIAHHSKLKTEKATFPLLLLDYPVKCDYIPPSIAPNQALGESLSKSLLYTKCLSELSVSPCERTCSETEMMEAERREKAKLKKMSNIKAKITESAVSLTPSQKLDWFDSYDVVKPIVEALLEICFNSRYEPEKVSHVGKARKVLLQSDKDYLQALVRTVERDEDYDNLYAEYRTSPDIYNYVSSMEEELKVPTNYEIMPDGSWIVSGKQLIRETEADYNMGPLSAFINTVLTSQYNIKSWNSEITDYAIQTANALRNSVQIPNDVIAFLLNISPFKMEFQKKLLSVTTEHLATGQAHSLREVIESSLEKNNDLLILFNSLGCALYRRSVFYFLFIGHPTDVMGFRSSNVGLPSVVRTIDLDSVIRRIHANRLNPADDQLFAILGIKTREITAPMRFMKYSPSDEELVYKDEKSKLESKADRKRMKILFLKDELEKEKKRVANFRKMKYGGNEYYSDIMEEEEFMYYEVEEMVYPSPKHYPMGDYPLIEPTNYEHEDESRRQPQVGYRYYQPDYNFKIQGTTALEDRKVAVGTHLIRADYFASTYAIMLAIHRPLEKWDFRRVDIAIENGTQLFNLIPDKNTCPLRKLQKIIIDNKVYNLEVREYIINQTLRKLPIDAALRRILENKRYFLVQFENATFAVVKQQYFHLFDPYKTLDKVKEVDSENKPIRLRKVKPLADRNTASWITFPNLDYLLTYVEERMTSDHWKEDFNLFVINVMSMKKVPRKEKLTQMLTSPFIPDPTAPGPSAHLVEMQTEKVGWLEMFGGIIPWSPLTSVNLDNEKRGTPATKWKSFDVELRGKLMSLWGHVHPKSVIFGANRGKQSLAINVMACCMARIYQVEEWTPNIINSIVVYGDKYFEASTNNIESRDYELSLEDLDTQFSIGKLCDFDIHLESVVYGLLYETKPKVFNLSRALSFFFTNYTYGVIQCMRKSLCFGKTQTGYFIFDCESYGKPLFEANQGCGYVLLTSNLDTLLYSIVMTLRIPYYNIEFVIHAVSPSIRPKETTKQPAPQPMSAPAQAGGTAAPKQANLEPEEPAPADEAPAPAPEEAPAAEEPAAPEEAPEEPPAEEPAAEE